MNNLVTSYEGRRVSYDGALCTVRKLIPSGQIPGTKGDWLGVEWDDPKRGKHNGTYREHQYFRCKSSHSTVASFIRPNRAPDTEKTVLEAIRFKYEADTSSKQELVIISGKVAEEIGFDKIAREQSVLSDLRIVLLDQLVVSGVAPRGSSEEVIQKAQTELAQLCPSIIELDLGYNPIERWSDVEQICKALPKLRVLKLNSLRFNSLTPSDTQTLFPSIQELHLNQCLVSPNDIVHILGTSQKPRFPILHTLWLSQNEFRTFHAPKDIDCHYTSIHTIMLENNFFTNLDSLQGVLAMFPNTKSISLQSNRIKDFGEELPLLANRTPPEVYVSLETLNLSRNQIQNFDLVDQIPMVFSNLTSLRISMNPVYDTPNSTTPAANPSETNYYLTLARIPNLKTLNYTNISTRERDEGEIYYLSIIEKEIKQHLTPLDLSTSSSKERELRSLQAKYPRYQSLCTRHDRESILTQLAPNNPNIPSLLSKQSKPRHPPGSLASRLVTTVFTIPLSQRSLASRSLTSNTFTRSIPTSIPTTQLFALVSRTLSLLPLQFKLIYESPELDPVRDDLTTRSQMYSTSMDAKQRWKEWGQWDVDHLVDGASSKSQTGNEGEGEEERWNEEGHLLRNGRKWVRREVEILLGMRAWGDYLDLDPDKEREGMEVKIRVELKGHMLKKKE